MLHGCLLCVVMQSMCSWNTYIYRFGTILVNAAGYSSVPVTRLYDLARFYREVSPVLAAGGGIGWSTAAKVKKVRVRVCSLLSVKFALVIRLCGFLIVFFIVCLILIINKICIINMCFSLLFIARLIYIINATHSHCTHAGKRAAARCVYCVLDFHD